MTDQSGFDLALTVEATGRATHPPDVLLDEQGHPALDENDEPIRKDQQ